MTRYTVGDRVSWESFDHRIMTGEIKDVWYNTYNVQLVHGGYATLEHDRVIRLATPEDILSDCEYYSRPIPERWEN